MRKKRDHHFAIKEFHDPETDKNEYLLINQDEAALIDISSAYGEIKDFINRSDLTVKYLLVTHAHPSHLMTIPKIKAEVGGIFCIHQDDYDLLKGVESNLEPDLFVKDKMILDLGDGEIQVLHTPGHTDGSVCFYVKDMDVVFTGRTLEKGGYGTIWGPTSMYQMLASLRRLNNIFYSTTIYPGRGGATSIPQESWLNCLRSV